MAEPAARGFEWRGVTLAYERGSYNDAAHNERAVEVPIVRHWSSCQVCRATDHRGRGLEVGNVLSHYTGATIGARRVIVDRYERADRVYNLDVLDFDLGTFDWIVSISTLEHVRWDETPRIECGAVHAIERLRGMLNEGGRLLMTAPTGCQRHLDAYLLERSATASWPNIATMVRSGDGWVQSPEPEVREYGPRWANAVWIAEFEAS